MSAPGRTDETSAGGVVYRLDRGRVLFLLVRDSYQNWGFPKGHLEDGERPEDAALREVAEETGLTDLAVRAPIDTIDWYFRFHGRVVHKTCHFFLMETTQSTTSPAHAEGITACRWIEFDEGESLVAYANARGVLRRANDLVGSFTASA